MIISRFGKCRAVLGAALLSAMFATSAVANGLGDSKPYQFRNPSEYQTRLNAEQVRLNERRLGVGSAAGLNTQTGNSTSININGSGNTINVTQTNSGNQTLDDSDIINGGR